MQPIREILSPIGCNQLFCYRFCNRYETVYVKIACEACLGNEECWSWELDLLMGGWV